MELTQVLLKPLITEKTTELKEAANRVAFLVHPDANKLEIKQAVEKAFSVTVESVNVVNVASRNRERQGRVIGKTQAVRKAYVTLGKDDKIEYFEGV